MMLDVGKTVSMTDEEFRLIRDIICDYCGIYFGDSMKFLVERRLQPRLPAFGFSTFRDYYRLIKYGRDRDREFDEIVERVTTNETYFFREQYQLKAFTDEILPALVSGREADRRVRIWSAGCSTGEEPYTHRHAARRGVRGARVLVRHLRQRHLTQGAANGARRESTRSRPSARRDRTSSRGTSVAKAVPTGSATRSATR